MNLSQTPNGLFALVLIISIAGFAGASVASQTGMQSAVEGVIEQIDQTTISHESHRGLGAIIGAAGGGLLGSLVGAGTGRDVAIAVGAIGGAVVGNRTQKKHDAEPGLHITVRLASGVLVVVTQPYTPDLKVGDKVVVTGQGQEARVSRI